MGDLNDRLDLCNEMAEEARELPDLRSEVTRLKAALAEAERGYRYEADVAQQAISDRSAALARVSALEVERAWLKEKMEQYSREGVEAQRALSAAQRDAERAREALEKIASLAADRQAFILLGPRAFAKAEQLARAALLPAPAGNGGGEAGGASAGEGGDRG